MTTYNKERFATEIGAITASLSRTLQSKNADYGNNVDKNIDEWGLSSLAIRLDDKLSRFKNLIKEGNKRQVSDEALEDTLLDLAGYAILGYRKLSEMNGVKMSTQVGETLAKMDIDRKPVKEILQNSSDTACNLGEIAISSTKAPTTFTFNS